MPVTIPALTETPPGVGLGASVYIHEYTRPPLDWRKGHFESVEALYRSMEPHPLKRRGSPRPESRESIRSHCSRERYPDPRSTTEHTSTLTTRPPAG